MNKKSLIIGSLLVLVAVAVPVTVNAVQDYRVANAADYHVDTFEHEGNKCYVAYDNDGNAAFYNATSVSVSISCLKK
jgi:hypothetical protein